MSNTKLDERIHGKPLDRSAKMAFAQVGWLGGSGTVYPLDKPPTMQQEAASYRPLYIQLGEWRWSEVREEWYVDDGDW